MRRRPGWQVQPPTRLASLTMQQSLPELFVQSQ
jgi:hypothetical protein